MKFKKFTECEIKNIYNKLVKKNIDYLSKYDYLNNDLINFLEEKFSNSDYNWKGRDYSRVRSILDFKEWIDKYNIFPNNLAYTYYDDPEMKILKYLNSKLIEYDGISGDLHELDHLEKYDFFLFNQTIEHLYNPFISINNIYNSLVDGGYVFTSVPTINIPHSTPIHFNGLTPIGLVMLFKSCGFEVLEVGQWGNYEYITKLFSNHQWPGFKDLSENGIKNEERNVVNCWILAKK